MARDTLDNTPIERRAELVAYLEKGAKRPDAFRIGTEHEKFAFHLEDLSPVPYEGERGIGAILKGMRQITGWEPIEEHGRVIGLADAGGGGAISVEPGGQFELSGAPLENLHESCREANTHLEQVRAVAGPMGVGFLGLGVAPTWARDDMPQMPKQRYQIMTNHMPQVGTRGLDMMYRTTTIQVNLDFSSEADMVAKMRVGLALQPIATALFANSPFIDGRPNGLLSNRAAIWHDVDLARSGPIPFAFEDGFGFERYVDWALDVPMYFVKRGDTYHDATSHTFRQFMDGGFAPLPDERATMGDWVNHLSTLFPEVRLKRFLEMRGADGGPWHRICALPAFWVGLMYDDAALAAAQELAAELSAEDRHTLWQDVPREGFAAKAAGRTVREIAGEALTIAAEGLKARGERLGLQHDERTFLAPLEDSVAQNQTPAHELLKAFHASWEGDIRKVFSSNVF